MYLYSFRRVFYVPKNFKFPTNVDLCTALRFWFNGHTVGDKGDFINGFRHLTMKEFHTAELNNSFNLIWNRSFKWLDLIEGLNMPVASVSTVSEGELSSIFDDLMNFLLSRFSFCFEMTNNLHITWMIGTWELRTIRSEFQKRGTDTEK